MRRVLIGAVCAASMLLMGGAGIAQAGDYDPPAPVQLPTTTSVTDVGSAESFLERYAARNAPRFLNVDRRRVRVIDVDAACVEHPIIAARFGCGFRFRALVIQRRHNWHNWEGHVARKSGHDPQPRPRRRVRIQTFGCLGLARVLGGVGVTPSVTVPLVECARLRSGDHTAYEPAPVV